MRKFFATKSAAHLFMILQTLIMAPSYVFGSHAARAFHPLVLVAFRAIIAASIFLFLFKIRKGFRNQPPSKKEWKFIFGLAVIGILINQTCFISGLHFTSPAHSAVFYSLTPLFVFLIAVFVAKLERLTFLKAFLVIAAVIGTMLVLFSRKAAVNAPNPLLGNVITLIGVISWAFFLTYSRPMMQRFDPFQLTAMIMTIGAIGFFPLGAAFLHQMEWQKVNFQAWFGLFYLIIVNSFLSYLLLTAALKQLTSSQVSVYINMQPIVATLISLWAGEFAWEYSFIFGSALCIMAIFGLTYAKT